MEATRAGLSGRLLACQIVFGRGTGVRVCVSLPGIAPFFRGCGRFMRLSQESGAHPRPESSL